MSEWRWTTIGELTVNFDSLRRPVKSSDRSSGGIPYYGASGIIDWVDGYTHDGTYLLIAEDGENLRSRSTPIAFMSTGKSWVNNHAHVVTGNHESDTRFLEYLFAVTDVLGYLTGSAQPKLSRSSLDSIAVRVPEVSEQQAIAEVLGALDDKIAANTKLAQTSATLTQALFADAVRAADHEVVLSEVTGLLSRGVTPMYSDAEDTVVVLNQKCIRDQRVNLDPARRTLISKVREDKLLIMDDVLVNSTGQGTLGRVARWTHGDSVTVDSHITIVRFDQAKVDPVCAGMALLGLQETIVEMGEGSTGQTELSRTELGKLRMRLPNRGLQPELGRRFTSMSEMERVHLRENQILATTRDTLLPQLMSGKLRVKDAEKILEEAGV
jgi:type I restriction enzyme, S subunit